MNNIKRSVVILVADDDEDDRMMTKEALEESRLTNEIRFVVDGEDLTDYLQCLGKYTEPGAAPRPGLILLDQICRKKTGAKLSRKSKPTRSCGEFRLSF